MNAVLWLIDQIIWIYIIIIIAMVVLSWLIAFNVVNPHNSFVRQVRYALYRLTEPLLGPIRRVMPDLGGIDISPMILLIGLLFVRKLIFELVPRA